MSRKLALLIGNSTYGPGLPRLEKPDADIAAFAKVLADPAIGGFDDVKPLLDATSATARREVARFFSGRSPDDLLVLYFSGHGLRDDRGGLYLAAQDTEADLLRGTAVPAAFISEEMDNCRSRRQILILDCCYSGAFEHGAKGPAANPATAFKGNGIGRFVLTASDSMQLAWEDVAANNQGGLSVFTHHLVVGLESGEADLDGDGLIGVDELYDYVYARVVEENPRQTPGKSASKQQGEIFLARNPTGPKLRPLPAELMQALDHPLATVREGAVRELGRFLRGSDEGMAKAARKAAEEACDDDSRRVAKAAAEVLAAIVQAPDEQIPPVPASNSTQALLIEARSWPLVLGDNFDSTETSACFQPAALNLDNKFGTRTGRISSGVLRLSYTAKTNVGGFSSLMAWSATTAADFYLRVDLKESQDSDSADGGLIFRAQDAAQSYAFMIHHGSYWLGAYTGRWRFLRPLTPSAAIHPGQTNSIAVVAKGFALTLLINGQIVDQVSDETFSYGWTGLGIQSNGVEPVAFDFDNFELRLGPSSATQVELPVDG
ncbi:MAG TPA: caspase family protein [Thermoanaerobaculia bacterium]|nr:caspase family protein [Thermoanaerobaculia bacterium]